MAAGPVAPVVAETDKVSIPEGLTARALVARIASEVPRFTAEDLDAKLDDGSVTTTLRPDGQTSWEGVLFPATYEVEDDGPRGSSGGGIGQHSGGQRADEDPERRVHPLRLPQRPATPPAAASGGCPNRRRW